MPKVAQSVSFWDTYKVISEAPAAKKAELAAKPTSMNMLVDECTQCGYFGDGVLLGICDSCV